MSPPGTDGEPVRVSLPRGAWLAAAATFAVMLGILTTQLVLQAQQRQLIGHQLAIARAQAANALPVLKATRPLALEARRLLRSGSAALPRARRLVAQIAELTADADPLVDDLSATHAPLQLAAAGELARELIAARAGTRLVSAGRLADALLARDAPGRIAQLADVSVRALPEGVALARQAVGVAQRLEGIAERLETMQRQALAAARGTLATARTTLAVARAAERHAASLDRKTGGELPAPAATRPSG